MAGRLTAKRGGRVAVDESRHGPDTLAILRAWRIAAPGLPARHGPAAEIMPRAPFVVAPALPEWRRGRCAYPALPTVRRGTAWGRSSGRALLRPTPTAVGKRVAESVGLVDIGKFCRFGDPYRAAGKPGLRPCLLPRSACQPLPRSGHAGLAARARRRRWPPGSPAWSRNRSCVRNIYRRRSAGSASASSWRP